MWLPMMSAAGVSTVRLFPEWRDIEPSKGTWNWDRCDALVKAAADNHIEINGILMGSPPGSKASHAFPMDDLDGWSDYVSAVVGRYKQIRYWEVWNEGNGGFNDGHHTTADYAKLAAFTYAAAKKANPRANVGLTVASFDAPYLNQAIGAMAKQGRPNSFDHLCIHPYEIADGLADPDGEIPFLWMTHLLRGMLKASAPERADAEIWITEVARRVEGTKGRVVTERDAAIALAKIYSMAIAQGIARTQWFEARDPVGEDQGFGLLSRDGTPRVSYTAFKTLTTHLGPAPKYDGWLALGHGGKGYGFVFQGKSAPVLVAWMPIGQTDKTLSFTADVQVFDALTGTATSLKASQPLTLTDAPVLIVGIGPELVNEARAHAKSNFPWGGDYSTAKTVSVEPGSSEQPSGVFQVQRNSTPTLKFPDGSTGILVRGDQAVNFYCHPTFADFRTTDYYVRISVRRVAPGNVGMNLNYEVADSQGRSPYKNRGQWFGATDSNDWQTYTWHISDACFSKMWGYDISFRPEQSVAFVIGKVEVSTEPFK
ncbi:MAG: hypothetical protein JWN24_2260 [Phycisphaerales bacterium]|nr:hypothetical protein [Phycisphaerales bacterium]